LRRLTNLEYRNTLRDLLGATPGTLAKDIGDSFLSGFARGATLNTGVDARQFLESSEAIASAAIKQLPALLPCKTIPADPAAQDECARQFVTTFGLRAFRRPVAPDEASELFKLFGAQRASGQFADGIEAVVSAILQSPYFLYRREVGPRPVRDGALVRFDSYEVASRLSYFLWASMPDDQLFAAAEKSELASPGQITAQARRMMADQRFKDAIRDFHLQWMNVDDVVGLQKDQLKASPDASGGTMFDSRVVLWGNHMHEGSDHASQRIPWLLATKRGGYLKTGQALGAGKPTSGALAEICNAMAVITHPFGAPLDGLRTWAPGGAHPLRRTSPPSFWRRRRR
jgi:Protein of unknown function (DUF1592)/Protein of unknown function (DUF1595)/Protein of unknown function (DUF1587)